MKKQCTAIICLSPYFGGMELDALRFSSLLADSTDIVLIVKDDSRIHQYVCNNKISGNVKIETVRFTTNFSFSIILSVRKYIRKYLIKNVIYFGASELKSLYFSFIGKDINLVIRHGTTKSRSKKDLFHRMLYSKVNWHIAICKHIAENVLNIIPLGASTRIKVIYSSLRFESNAADYIRTIQDREKKLILTHISRVTEGKGQLDAILACKSLYDVGIPFELIFVGDIDENYKEKLDDTIVRLPYSASIKFEGFKTDVARYYNNSDIFIFPSKGEGLSNSFIEALTCGLLCISYENTSFPELRQLGFDFLMARNLDTNSLCNTLLKAVDYLKEHQLPIQANIALGKKLFSRDKELADLLEILV